jgi:hypothetical protein
MKPKKPAQTSGKRKYTFRNLCASGNILSYELTFSVANGEPVKLIRRRGWWERTPNAEDKYESEMWELLIGDHLTELFGLELAKKC